MTDKQVRMIVSAISKLTVAVKGVASAILVDDFSTEASIEAMREDIVKEIQQLAQVLGK